MSAACQTSNGCYIPAEATPAPGRGRLSGSGTVVSPLSGLETRSMAANNPARKSPLRLVAESAPKDIPKVDTKWAGRVPHVKPGRYADGLPFHQINYLACKLVLRPNKFTSRQSLFDFAKVLRVAADQCAVGLSTKEFKNWPLSIREVLFIDTEDHRLYNNAFILRGRFPFRAARDRV
jgi:hypothetical protein